MAFNLFQDILENNKSTDSTEVLDSEGAADGVIDKILNADEETNDKEDTDNQEVDKEDSDLFDEESYSDFENALKQLSDSNFITELPEGIENVDTVDDYNRVIEHNFSLRLKEITEKVVEDTTKDVETKIFQDFRETLNPFTLDLLKFELGAKRGGGDVIEHARNLLYAGSVSSLDVEDILDQERIVETYYTQKNVDKEEIYETIELLKDNPEKMRKRAAELKPDRKSVV